MQIDDNLVKYLEELSKLSFAEDERARVKKDLNDIIGYMDKLSELDTTGVPERSHPFDNANAFREDMAGESFATSLVLGNAPDPDLETGAYRVPKTVE